MNRNLYILDLPSIYMVKKEKDNKKTESARVICRVWEQKKNHNTKLITIPKWSDIKAGDYVEVVKV